MLPQAKTTTYGTSSLTFRGSILWNSLPDAIKSSPSVVYFKRSIKEGRVKIVHAKTAVENNILEIPPQTVIM